MFGPAEVYSYGEMVRIEFNMGKPDCFGSEVCGDEGYVRRAGVAVGWKPGSERLV